MNLITIEEKFRPSQPNSIFLVPMKLVIVIKIGDLGLRREKYRERHKSMILVLEATPSCLAPLPMLDRLQEPPSDICALECLVLEMFKRRQGKKNVEFEK